MWQDILKRARDSQEGGAPLYNETLKDQLKIEPVLKELSRPVGAPSEAQ